MKQIKFKIFDTHTKVMSEPLELSEIAFSFNVIWQDRMNKQKQLSGCDVVWRPFIGLQDKNQVDIYQGDRVSFEGLTGIVKFSEQIAGFYIEYQRPPLRAMYTRRFDCTYGDGENYIDSTIEVIGNIYQK